MAPKKSVEDLDAELAELEAELAALESGEDVPPPKKGKKKPPRDAPEAPEDAEGAEEPEAPKPKRKLGLRKKAEAAEPGEPEAPEEAPGAPKPKRKLGLRRKAEAAAPEPEPAEEPAEAAADDEAPKRKLPFGRKKEAPEPEPEPVPEEPPAPSTAWESRGGAWRARPPAAQKVEVVRRTLDPEGRVVDEETVGEEVEQAPEPEPAPKGRFGFLRSKAPEEAPSEPGAPEAAPPARGGRRKKLLLPVILVVAAVLAVAVVLPAVGVDPLGVGGILGIGGGGGDAAALPVARLAASADTVVVGTAVTFDAAGSADPAGGALEHSWDFGDGSGDQGPTATHTYAAAGTYTVTLTVRNSAGRTATATAVVTVAPPPVARISLTLGGSPVGGGNSPVAGEELAFDGSGSTAEGGVAAYEWAFGDGARATGATAAHSYASPGSYRVTLTVADGGGLRGNASVAVYVGQRAATAADLPGGLGRQAANTTVDVVAAGGALPYRPLQLRATLTFNATAPAPLPLPGGLNPDTLDLAIYDASGAVVAAAPSGPSPKELVVTDFGGALGSWNVEVSRPAGGAQAQPYTLEIELLNQAA